MQCLETSRAKLLRGAPLHFSGEEPAHTRFVEAEWIAEAAKQSARIVISKGIITGALHLKYVSFPEEVSIIGCKVTDAADFSCATFKRKLDLSHTAFGQGADLSNVILEYDANLTKTYFDAGQANFLDLQARGTFVADGARFARGVEAMFHRARFEKAASFKGTQFESGANFIETKILGSATFEQAQFNSRDEPAKFETAEIDHDAHFESVIFRGDARFMQTQIGGNALFYGAAFAGRTEFIRAQVGGLCGFGPVTFNRSLSFNSASLNGGISFGNSRKAVTEFKGDADFMHAKIASCDFQLAIFTGRALFVAAEIGRAIFRGALFQKGSDPSFRGAHFMNEALFQGAVFADKANFMDCHFASMAHFSREERSHEGICFPGAAFHEASFNHAQFEADGQFEETIFHGNANFRETTARVLLFSSTGHVRGVSQFQGKTDLRGCTYDSIQADWKTLLGRFVGATNPQLYDRQPYLQLERSYRQAGRDHDADDIYLCRQLVERGQKRAAHQRGPWLKSFLHGFIANYGVRPYRLLVIPIILLALGTIVLSRPNAVSMKREAVEVSPPAAQERPTKSSPESEGYSRWGLAARLSFRIFIPVELPLASHWEPSDGHLLEYVRFSDVATVLKIGGWILVPLGVAALTGLLRTKPTRPAAE
jgi:uncharacterized protein YjbI with pentapeptide repeats